MFGKSKRQYEEDEQHMLSLLQRMQESNKMLVKQCEALVHENCDLLDRMAVAEHELREAREEVHSQSIALQVQENELQRAKGQA